MGADLEPILSSRYGVTDSHRLAVAERHGAYATARKALTTMQPAAITEEVKKASLRGRGGAGDRKSVV